MSVTDETIQELAERLAGTVQNTEGGAIICKELEILLALFYRREIALGEHCCWDGRLLGRATWHDLLYRLAEMLFPLVTTDRRFCPDPPIDLVFVDSTRKALLYFNESHDSRIGLTPLGRKVVKAMIPRTLVTINKWSSEEEGDDL